MLTENDIDLMNEWRSEMVALRRRPIDLIYFVKEYDDFTKELIKQTEDSRTVLSVVTELSSSTDASAERYMEGGIKYEQGDIWLSVEIGLVEDIADKIARIRHDGKDYKIIAMDKKGIGRRNRYEILGRLVA